MASCARTSGAILAQLVERRALALELRLHARPVACRSACACSAICCASASASAARRGQLLSARSTSSAFSLMRCSRSASAAARCCSIACTRRSRSRIQPVDALERRLRAAPPLFQAGQLRRHLRRFLLQRLALLPQSLQLRLLRVQAALGLRMLCFKPRCLFALLCDRLPLGLARVLVARRLRIHSCRRRSMRCASASICFSAAPRLAASLSAWRRSSLARFKLRRQLFDRRVSASASISACASSASSCRQPAFRLAQFALQRQRTFARRLAARHRRVVEALALRREEIRMRVAQRQPLRIDRSSPPDSRAAASAESLRATAQSHSAL